jgi:hypothetical protein
MNTAAREQRADCKVKPEKKKKKVSFVLSDAHFFFSKKERKGLE